MQWITTTILWNYWKVPEFISVIKLSYLYEIKFYKLKPSTYIYSLRKILIKEEEKEKRKNHQRKTILDTHVPIIVMLNKFPSKIR